MFRNAKLATQMMLLPLLAGGGFVFILLVSWLVGARNAELLTQIEEGYAPALEIGRDLEETLLAVHRGMTDAVITGDSYALEELTPLRDRFVERPRQSCG
jgi:hypothetical protein